MDDNSNPLKKEELLVFKSLEDAAAYDARQNASISGIEHLRNVTAFIMQRYKKELETPSENILYFKNDGHTDSGI